MSKLLKKRYGWSLVALNTRWVCLFDCLVPLRGVGEDVTEEGTCEVALQSCEWPLNRQRKGKRIPGRANSTCKAQKTEHGNIFGQMANRPTQRNGKA